MKKGEIYVKKLLTDWFFWECPWPKCDTKIKGPNEGFTIKASESHLAHHKRVEEEAARKKVRLEQLAWTRGKSQTK